MRRLQDFLGANHRTDHPTDGARSVGIGRLVLSGALTAVLGMFLIGQPAWTDEGDSVDEGHVIVQQALSYLVNDPGKSGTAEALMKVDEALMAKDQDGIDVSRVKEAKVALQSGDVAAGRTLLQNSITEAVSALKPAIGVQTGTTVVLQPLPPRGPLTPVDWILLALSAIVAVVGVVLATVLRPRESLRDLGRDISGADGLRHEHSDVVSHGGR